jgi:hypothetical protein
MAGRVALDPHQLAAHTHEAEGALDGAPDRPRQLADRIGRQVAAAGLEIVGIERTGFDLRAHPAMIQTAPEKAISGKAAAKWPKG